MQNPTVLFIAVGCNDHESLLKEMGKFDQAMQTGTEAIELRRI